MGEGEAGHGDAVNDAAPRALSLLVSGIVQGVGYRNWTAHTARELGLAGWVRNLHDGRVEIHAEGAPGALEALRQRCARGPRHAEVSGVEHREVAATGARAFAVLATADAPAP